MVYKVYGKWVLAGEHTVLTGGRALALPYTLGVLALTHDPHGEPSSLYGLVSDAIRMGMHPQGSYALQSSIPLGAGLGSSAALCVAFTRSLGAQDVLATATQFEHRFHGTSSGMDVAATYYGRPILFSMQHGARPQNVPFRFTFHDTGLRAETKNAIEQVRSKASRDLTHMMESAVSLAEKACERRTYPDLIESMNLSYHVFEHWGLIPDVIATKRKALLRQGALAVRLTGAGLGGVLVALEEVADESCGVHKKTCACKDVVEFIA